MLKCNSSPGGSNSCRSGSAMATATTLMTADEFARLPDTKPYELVRGELVEMNRPTFAHGRVCINIGYELESWARKCSAGMVVSNDSGVVTTRNPDSVRGPDVAFVRAERVPPRHLLKQWLDIPPDLIVEVLSPGDRWRAMVAKVGEYLESGVREVWIADPSRRELHIFRPDRAPVLVTDQEAVASESVLPGFSCRVGEFFRDV
ncbi:MAG: Uma2 family endonuclease [Planctomycetales bacterium]